MLNAVLSNANKDLRHNRNVRYLVDDFGILKKHIFNLRDDSSIRLDVLNRRVRC
jgi:hypothetical protein